MGKYQTEQKKRLISYMREHKNRQFSAEQLSELLSQDIFAEGKVPGKSTVYRLVSDLTKEGVLRRFPKNEGRGWLYQYHQMSDCCGHLHLKCNRCGKLLHLECGMSKELLTHIEKVHAFEVDNNATVLYGLCASCKNNSLEKGSFAEDSPGRFSFENAERADAFLYKPACQGGHASKHQK